MTRSKKLIGLVIVFAVILGGYLIAKNLTDKPEESENAVELFSVSDAKTLSWTLDNDSVALVRQENEWKLSGDDRFPVDQEAVQTIMKKLDPVTAERAVEGGEPSEYGLENPALTITVDKSDGQKIQLKLGDKNEVSGDYYMMTEDGKVYMMSAGFYTAFSKTQDDLLKMEEIPQMDEISELQLQKDGGQNLTISRDGDGWTVDGQAADSAKIDTYLSNLSNLTWVDCEDYAADEAKKAAAGLEPFAGRISVKYQDDQKQEQSFVLLIGSSDGTNYRAAIENSAMIYNISKSAGDALMAASVDTLKAAEETQTEATETAETAETE